MADRTEDAQLGLICQAAYCARGPVTNPPARIPLPEDWELRGFLSAKDAIYRGSDGQLGERVYYGILAESKEKPGNFVVAIRGTINMVEWGENGEFALKRHPLGHGKVEAGFYNIYETLQLGDTPAVAGIFAKAGLCGTATGSLTIVGHSLGAAMASYLTLDLAGIPGMRVRGRYFASPHPGDAGFAMAFDLQVADYVSYAYELDVVPRVPFGFGYSHLLKMAWLSPKNVDAKVRFDVGCHHYLLSYVSMLDFGAFAAAAALDASCADCIKATLAPVIPLALTET